MSSRPWVDVVTTARADYSLILPVAKALQKRTDVATRVVFTGSHYSRNERDGIARAGADWGGPVAYVPCAGIGESHVASGVALGEMTAGLARLWAEERPAITLVLGDRFEILAPAAIAVLNGIPIAHLYGGEEDVACCFDTQVRNGVTKMAHLHLVMHEAQQQRLIESGEESWRIHVVGNTSMEAIGDMAEEADAMFAEWADEVGLGPGPVIAACYLPATAFPGIWRSELEALLAALGERPEAQVVWAGVNSDPESAEIQRTIEAHCVGNPRHRFVTNLGRLRFYGLLRRARALVGNSSSGLLEAASFGLPAINVGVRQTGRLSGSNVINTPAERSAVREALAKVLDDDGFRRGVAAMGNPFVRRGACARVADLLAQACAMDVRSLTLKRYSQGNPGCVGALQRVRELPPFSDLRGDFQPMRAF